MLLFEYVLWDQNFEKLVISTQRKSKLRQFLCLNYHFIGFAKKVLLFLVLSLLHDYLAVQLWIALPVLGVVALKNIALRTHINGLMNFLKSFADLLLVGYFISLYLIDQKVRELEEKPESYLV